MEGQSPPPPPPPPPGSSSPPNGRFVRRQHQEADPVGLDATQRPPPPSDAPTGRLNPRSGNSVSPNHPSHHHATAVTMPSNDEDDEESIPTGGGRKLRAIRRIASFNKLTSVPERLQQWVDGFYSGRYSSSSSLGTDAETPSKEVSSQQAAINSSIAAASLRLHNRLATFALSHCFDSELFDVPEGNAAAQLKALSTLATGSGAGVDHATKALHDKWCETFEGCLDEFVAGVLRINEAELGATLDLDKREEESVGEGVSLFGGAGNTPIHDLRAAIAPLAYMLDKRSKISPSTTPRSQALSSRPPSGGKNNQTPSPLSLGDVSSINPALGSSSVAATPTAATLSFGEKEHFYRWNDCIDFAAFVAEMRGSRSAIAKLTNASNLAAPEIATHFATIVKSVIGTTAVQLSEHAFTDLTSRSAAQKAARSIAQQLALERNTDEKSTSAALAFYFVTPLISFIRDRSVAARQSFRKKSALVPLMSVWCPMSIDEDIWPVIQSLISASGVTIPPAVGSSGSGASQTFRIVLSKQQQKELTLFRIRLSAAGKKAEAAAQLANGGVSATLISSPQYLLKPTAAAVGAVVAAVELSSDAQMSASQTSSNTPSTKASAAAPLDASEDPEKDWMRFLAVFAEGLDSATFDNFLSYMFSVMLPSVITKDCTEIVRISKEIPPQSPASPGGSPADAFWSSVSSPLQVSPTKKTDPATLAAVNGAARTVKRVFWVAFQQLDQYRRDKIPLGAVLELLTGTADEIRAIHEASRNSLAGMGMLSSVPHSRSIPHDLLVSLAELSRVALEKLASYVRFNTKDKSKLLIRLKNEKIATTRDAAMLQMFEDVTRGSAGSGSQKDLTSVQNQSPNTEDSANETTITMAQFVHIIKDLVFDPQYIAAHPSSSVVGSPSSPVVSGSAAPDRHLYWSELVAFVEVLMAISNQPKYKQLFRKI